MTDPHMRPDRRSTVRRAALLAVIVPLTLLAACSGKGATRTSQPAPADPAAASADLTVDGHAHTFSGGVTCTSQSADPSATPPRGNLVISASDDTASFSISWLSNARSPVALLSLTFTTGGGEYSTPAYPNPPNVQATAQGKSYTVKGTPPVQPPGENAMRDLAIQIHVNCP